MADIQITWNEGRYKDPGCIIRHALLHHYDAVISIDGAERTEFSASIVEEIIPNVFTDQTEEGGGDLCVGFKSFVNITGGREEQEIPLFVGVILPLVKAITELVLHARIEKVLLAEGEDDHEVEIDNIIDSVEEFLNDELKGEE